MKKKIVSRISNEIGNQLFIYASTYAIAKKLDRVLLIDNETSFKTKKNISKYGLNNFKISSAVANDEDKFLGLSGYIKRKIFKKIDYFSQKKHFYIEEKDEHKKTKYNNNFDLINLADKTFFEGYFETEMYFTHYKEEILREFDFKDFEKYKKNPFYLKVNQKNSISVCLRQNRFIEGKNTYNKKNVEKSIKFRDEQISYINKSIFYIKKHISNPIFYLWSNDLDNIDMSLFDTKLIKVFHNQKKIEDIDKRALDLFLISKCNHHITIPSSFNWWGAWLCQKSDKIICRPDDNFFSDFFVNNKDFWPIKWIKIT